MSMMASVRPIKGELALVPSRTSERTSSGRARETSGGGMEISEVAWGEAKGSQGWDGSKVGVRVGGPLGEAVAVRDEAGEEVAVKVAVPGTPPLVAVGTWLKQLDKRMLAARSSQPVEKSRFFLSAERPKKETGCFSSFRPPR